MNEKLSALYLESSRNSNYKFSVKDKSLILKAMKCLNGGEIRVAEKIHGKWTTNAWVKEAILLYFKIQNIVPIKAGKLEFLDKIPMKKWSAKDKVRVVPPAVARYTSYVAPGCILMPSYVNVGAYVDSGSMVDTWATVGSCAQIGKNVHLSGGVGIGGVLEPAQAAPVIVEDNAFLGSRCIVVEGVKIGESAVIAAGVTLTASTRIVDVTGSKERVFKGEVPPFSVVIPSSTPKNFPAGTYPIPSALIIAKRSEKTDQKTSLNQVLREFEISV